MQAIIIILFIYTVKSYEISVNDIEQSQVLVKTFKQFQKDFNKTYKDDYELIKRFTIFQDNLKRIEEIQEKDQGAEYGITQFTDLTTQEFKEKYLMDLNTISVERDYNLDYSLPINYISNSPDSFDWRDHGAVTPIQDQGMCGSCWAFSSIANIEGQYYLKHNELKKFSEQQLVQCDNVDMGCSGGWQEDAFKYLNGTGGLMLEKDYPYEGGSSKDCQFDLYNIQAKVDGYKFITQNETQIKDILVETGPLSIGVDAQAWQFYKSGVSDPYSCSDDEASIDHAVTLVGYGNEETGIITKTKKDYWLVKNSWGKKWGESGYIKMLRGKGKCAVNKHVLTSFIE